MRRFVLPDHVLLFFSHMQKCTQSTITSKGILFWSFGEQLRGSQMCPKGF